MYSARLLELFQTRAHGGPLPEATHRGEAGTPGQGPYITLRLQVEEGMVRAARWKTYGCPAAMASAEAVCAWSEGQPVGSLALVTAGQVTEWLGGVPEGKDHCPELAAAAARGVHSV